MQHWRLWKLILAERSRRKPGSCRTVPLPYIPKSTCLNANTSCLEHLHSVWEWLETLVPRSACTTDYQGESSHRLSTLYTTSPCKRKTLTLKVKAVRCRATHTIIIENMALCMSIIHATLCFVREIQTEYKQRRSRGLYDGLYFPGQNKEWHCNSVTRYLTGMYYTYADPV